MLAYVSRRDGLFPLWNRRSRCGTESILRILPSRLQFRQQASEDKDDGLALAGQSPDFTQTMLAFRAAVEAPVGEGSHGGAHVDQAILFRRGIGAEMPRD